MCYVDDGWLPDRSFTCVEMQALQDRTQAAAQAPALEATEHHKTHDAPRQLNSVTTEGVNAVDRVEAATMPEDLAAGEKEKPREVLPASPVDVGAVDADEQAMRHARHARAVPEDVVLAERLMAAAYANLVQGQPAELRSCLPSNPPELFRAQRYFSTLEMAVWQREDEEKTEQMM